MTQKPSRKTILTGVTFIEALTHSGNANPFRGDPSLGFDSHTLFVCSIYLAGKINEPPPAPFRMKPLVPTLALFLSARIRINNAFGIVNTLFLGVMVGYLFLIVGFFLVLRRRPDRRLYVLEGAVADIGLLCWEITLTPIPLMVLVRVVRDRLPLKALLEELFTVSFIAALPISRLVVYDSKRRLYTVLRREPSYRGRHRKVVVVGQKDSGSPRKGN